MGRLLSSGGELVTVVAGEDAPHGLADEVAALARPRAPRRRGQSSSTAGSRTTPCCWESSRRGGRERPSCPRSIGRARRAPARQGPRAAHRRRPARVLAAALPRARDSDLSSLHDGMYVVAVAEVKSASTTADAEAPRGDAQRHRSPTGSTTSTSRSSRRGATRRRWCPGSPRRLRRRGRDLQPAAAADPPRLPDPRGRTRQRRRRPRPHPGLPPGQGDAELVRRRVRADRLRPPRRRPRAAARRRCARGTDCQGGWRRCAASTSRASSARSQRPGTGCATRRRSSSRRLLAQRRAQQAAESRRRGPDPARGRPARGLRRPAALRAHRRTA